MSVSEFSHLSDREILLLVAERVDTAVKTIDKHETDIASLQMTRASNSGFFHGVNWLLGLPGLAALLFIGKEKM